MAEIIGQIPEAGKTIQWIINRSEDWTREEIETVVAPIREHMQLTYEKYGIIGNNFWQLYKYASSQHFIAKKRTWEYGSCHGATAEECATSIKEYFAKH